VKFSIFSDLRAAAATIFGEVDNFKKRSMRAAKKVAVGSLVCVGLCCVGKPASASVLWSFQEIGGNVVGTLSGSLDITDADLLGQPTSGGSLIYPLVGGIFAANLSSPLDQYSIAGPSGFGGGLTTYPDSITGSAFGLDGALVSVYVPRDYSSGTALSGTMIFESKTLADLGVVPVPGTYVWTLPHDTITVKFGVAATPLPATLPLFASGLGAMGLLGWRRKRRKTRAASAA
jgi:hypothetical protein